MHNHSIKHLSISTMRKIVVLILLSWCGLQTVSAQTDSLKYGHTNLGNILDQMSETAAAESQLKVLADSLNLIDSVKTDSFQTAYLAFKTDYDAGKLTRIQVEQGSAELEKQRQAIQKFEADAQQQLETKRNELLGPILVKVQEAITAVAKENNFAMIFDVSTGAMLFAADTIDVTDLIKQKLGMK